jgi:hypothetical protein
MKNRSTFILSIFVIGLSYLLLAFNTASTSEYTVIEIPEMIEIPSDVLSLLENKCFECHTSKSKGSKSKLKLNFDKFTNGNYSNGKLVSKFGKITKQLNNNKMPPKKYLGKNPDKKLSSEESELIISWATEQSGILAGE